MGFFEDICTPTLSVDHCIPTLSRGGKAGGADPTYRVGTLTFTPTVAGSLPFGGIPVLHEYVSFENC